uniref:6-phosphofructo-2-kinase/fructose-2,6-bisphosphatase-like isoform X1 n=2 Tax=Hirondellea gigas TaxID=1518452 RepID=A0A6A7G6N2_9CRUS
MIRLRRVSYRDGTITDSRSKHVVVMVGLPARGKTYMAKKLTRYLNWIGIKTKVFNNGDYVRKLTTQVRNHNFFRSDNEEALKVRRKCALDAIADAAMWLENEEGQVAVFDATNTTRDRRRMIQQLVEIQLQFRLFFIESICDDETLVQSNIKEVKLNGPDYRGMNPEDALNDFLQRIRHYEENYEPLDEHLEQNLSYMKIYNTGEKVLVHKHSGHVQAKIVYYLMNIHISKRTIYFTRHGESVLNQRGRIGGDAPLSCRGREYARKLASYINEQNIDNLRVWTSWLQRTIQTASEIDAPQERWKALNEIDAGICEEMSYAEIKEKHPEEFATRDKNKFSYRYHRGESYEDLVARLEPVIMELERENNVLVVAHQAVLRCLLAYFLDKTVDELPYIEVPLHTIIQLTPVAYGCEMEYLNLNVPCVNTHRCKPDAKACRDTMLSGLLQKSKDANPRLSACMEECEQQCRDRLQSDSFDKSNFGLEIPHLALEKVEAEVHNPEPKLDKVEPEPEIHNLDVGLAKLKHGLDRVESVVQKLNIASETSEAELELSENVLENNSGTGFEELESGLKVPGSLDTAPEVSILEPNDTQ